MFKKLSAAALCLCLLLSAGCSKKNNSSVQESGSDLAASSEQTAEKVYYNPLTGLSGISADKANARPVAIMINNIETAQSVQCGLAAADLVFETEVEGGITRLMAVYQDVSRVERIGSVRSARYAYIDLAMGLNAVYCHHGQDPTYAKPHLSDTDDFTIDENNAGKRIANGKSSEHTLYAFGSLLWNTLSEKRNMSGSGKQAFNFAAEEQEVALSGGGCSSVTVPFSNAQKTSFEYDAAAGCYTVKSNGTVRKDYISGETAKVENVFVLLTSISDYPDGYHRNVSLTGGSGYYIANGTYTPISWSKGAAKNALSVTNTDGSPLTVSAGSSWICIADKNKAQPVIG